MATFEEKDQNEKLRALESSILSIEKEFGKGSIMKLGSRKAISIDHIPTGSLLLDAATGVGGFPRGRVVEIFGPESSGKTTIALHVIAEAQKRGGIAAFIDAEHALDPVYAKALGVNINDLWISQPDTGEQALEIVETLVKSSAVDVVVIDSVAALTPKAEIEGEMGDSHMGLQARLMSQALRKLTAIVSKSNTCVVFINQLRMKIGVMFGNPETTTGGNALKFYSSMRIEVRKIETLTNGTEAYGNKVRVKIVKNKMAPPFREVQLDIIYGQGISREESIIDASIKFNLIQKTGSWYSFGDKKIGQGRETVKKFFSDNPGVMESLEAKIRAIIMPKEENSNGNSKNNNSSTAK
ncbi:MAG: recombinase RecA [Spirochaetes bacterium]|nr:recombinase RecA [Spirochaetota bacterium]